MTSPARGTSWAFGGESAPVATAATVTLVHGSSFAICQPTGDIGGGPVDGVFVGDTRICSFMRLSVDGRPLESLTVTNTSPFTATFVGRLPPAAPGQGGVLVTRSHWVGGGFRSDVTLRNFARSPRRLVVHVELAADHAGLFAVKEGRAVSPPAPVAGDGAHLRFGEPGVKRGSIVRFAPTGAVDTPADAGGTHGVITWVVDLGPAGGDDSWSGSVEIAAVRRGTEVAVGFGDDSIDDRPRGATRWAHEVPTLRSDVEGLDHAVSRASEDLRALCFADPEHPDEPVLAAGAPWFMTLFGRDSILASSMALVINPDLALSTAHALARLQGRSTDPHTEEEPGRILHEVRPGDQWSLALSAGHVYYGSADATPLFVCLVHELLRWGVPLDSLRSLLPAVDAALGWMSGPGDKDGDGYIEYERATRSGLANQGWKDSWDGISCADGSLPRGPIALAEVQGYAYAAWLAGAALADAVGDEAVAEERRDTAGRLRAAFNRDFWLGDRGYVALALDGDKKPVDALASNMGHCLWSGILDPEVAVAVAAALVDPGMASGWGIRTLATTMQRYDPLSYHNGSVWPHDTALCIAGLRRYGFVEATLRLTEDLLAAAAASGGRLPELFSGLSRAELPVPVPYPASCSPQAWAAAAPLLIVRALLGLEPDIPGSCIELDPVLPEGASFLRLTGVPLAGARVDIEVEGDAVAVRNMPRGLSVVRRAT